MIYLPTFSKAKNSDINIYEPLLGSVVLKEFISMKPYLVRMTTLYLVIQPVIIPPFPSKSDSRPSQKTVIVKVPHT